MKKLIFLLILFCALIVTVFSTVYYWQEAERLYALDRQGKVSLPETKIKADSYATFAAISFLASLILGVFVLWVCLHLKHENGKTF